MAALNLALLHVGFPARTALYEGPAPPSLVSALDAATATDISWFSAAGYAATARYEIAGAAQLAGLAALVNGTSPLGEAYDFAGKTVAAAGGRFDLSAYTDSGGWTPIGTEAAPFRGIFDGGGATVTDLTIDRGSGISQGLFGVVAGTREVLAGVRNLTVVNATVQGGMYTGAVVGRASYCALGRLRAKGGFVAGSQYTGGVAGSLGAGSLLENCAVSATVSGEAYTGGVAGSISASGTALHGSTAGGTVSGDTKTGGMVGEIVAGARVEDCAVTAAVSGTGAFTGGIAGYCEGTVDRCLAGGGVTGAQDTGGVVGGLGGGAVENVQLGATFGGGILRASANTGAVQGGRHTGGVAGFVAGNDDHLAVLEQCYNTGDVTGEDYTGGVAGHIHGLLQNSYNTGSVAGASRTGGVTGGLTTFSDTPPPQRGTLRSSYNSGSVAGEVYVGGICGSLRGGEISAAVALGPSVTGASELVTARVYGGTPLNVTVLDDNYAWQGTELRLNTGGTIKAFEPAANTVGAARQNGEASTADALLASDRAALPPWNAYPATGAGDSPLWNLATPLPILHGAPGPQGGAAPPYLQDEPDFGEVDWGKFVNHPGWLEVTGEEAYYRYRSGETFITVYYRADCADSKAWRALYHTWMARYGVTIYGVRIQAEADVQWLFPGSFEVDYTRPVTAFAHQLSLQTFDGVAPAAQVQRAFEAWPGHVPRESFDFLDINREALAGYESANVAAWLKAEPAIQTGNVSVKKKSAEIVRGAITAREKAAAIHAWVSANVYFDEEMLVTGAGRPTDAAGILAQAGKSPNKMHTSAQGFANLTAALCRAAGVPCRVVSGFAGAVGSAADAEAMRAAYAAYGEGGLSAFGEAASTLRNHVWNAVFVEGEWLYIDAALDSRNAVHISKANGYAAFWVADAPRSNHLFPALEDFSKTHCTWDGDALVPATGFALEWPHVKLPAGMAFRMNPLPLPARSAFRPGTSFTWSIPESTIAAVDATGLVTALNPGKATLGVAFAFGGKPKTLSGSVTVVEALAGIRMEGEVRLHPGEKQTLGLLPVPAASLVYGEVAWSVVSGQACASVDERGVVTALAGGVAQVRAVVRDANGLPLSATCAVRVSAPVEAVSVLPQSLTLTVGEVRTLDALVSPVSALQHVAWRSDDETVAEVSEVGDTVTTVKAQREGTAVLWATAADGHLSALCRVTVEAAPVSTLLVTEEAIVLAGTAPATLHLSINDTSVPVEFALYRASTREKEASMTDVLARTEYTAASGTEAELLIAAAPEARAGAYVLRVQAGGAWAECRLTVAQDLSAARTEADFAELYLDTAAATLWTRSDQNPTVVVRQARDGRLPLNLADDARVTVRLKGGEKSKWHGLFAFKAVDGERLELVHTLPAKPASRYNLELEAFVDLGGGKTFTLPIKGKLAVTVKTGSPKLSASAVTINTFYASKNAAEDEEMRTAAISINGAEAEKIRLREGKAQPDWVTLNAGEQTVTVAPGKTKKSGVLHLEVLPKGWGADVPVNWVAVSLKVTHVYAAPGVKLSAARVSVYEDLARWTGSPLALKSKSGKATLARLGVTGVEVAPEHADRFAVKQYDPVTGGFTLAAAPGADAAKLGGSVTLLVSFLGTSETLPLAVRAVPVKANAAVRLRAARTVVTLNPALENGERVDIALSASIPGFDLSQYSLSAAVYDSSGKKAPPNDDYAPTASVCGSTLTLRAGRHAAPGKTYKVKVTLPGANRDKKGQPADEVLTITLKTARKGTAVKAGLSVTGKLDLTTGAKARITAKFTGALGGFEGMPAFILMDAKGNPLSQEIAKSFKITAHPDGGWQVGLWPGRTLEPGTYRIGADAGRSPLDGGGYAASVSTARFTVVASTPKITLSAKTATLFHNDLDSEAVIHLQIPGGAMPIAEVTLAGSEKDSFAYTLRDLGGGYYAVVFDRDKPQKTLQNARGGKLTVRVRLEGCEIPAQKLSLSLRVKYRK